jgi:hypothetical protein
MDQILSTLKSEVISLTEQL